MQFSKRQTRARPGQGGSFHPPVYPASQPTPIPAASLLYNEPDGGWGPAKPAAPKKMKFSELPVWARFLWHFQSPECGKPKYKIGAGLVRFEGEMSTRRLDEWDFTLDEPDPEVLVLP